jgi:hypothetical protein
MIDRDFIERYLAINGIEPSAPDDQIKKVLFSAQWHEEDVETALTVLREDAQTHETHVDSLHKVFHTDDRLQPETISSLLGIDVDLPPAQKFSKKGTWAASPIFMTALVAFTLSLAFVLVAMWQMRIGLFTGL